MRVFTRLRRRDDRGSMLPMVVGFVAIVLALVTVVTDVGALWLQRRALQASVDGAALAGAQAVDLPTVYAGGAHGDLRLNPAQARQAVARYVAGVPATGKLSGFRIALVRVSTTTVRVRAQSTARLPFLSALSGRGITIVAEAQARTTAD